MKHVFTLILLLAGSITISAQHQMVLKDSTGITSSTVEAQYDYENYLSPFPPKKANNWAIGIAVGTPILLSDIRPLLLSSIGLDLKVRKAFSPIFSIRYQGIFAQAEGLNYFAHTRGGEPVHLNYQTRITENSLQGVFTLNNMKFFKKQSRVGFNFFGGVGMMTAFTRSNFLDESGTGYDYSQLSDIESFSDRRFVVNELLNLMDESFETVVKPDNADAAIKDTRLLPSIILGGGMDIKITPRTDFMVEARLSKHFTDLLDGYHQGRGNDWFLYTSVGLNFKVGKRTEPLYWVNPLEQPYTDIMEMKSGFDPAKIYADFDGDGVIDALDLDSNTPAGVAVNLKGLPLDSDKDGIADYRDSEVYSLKGAKVDQSGMALDGDLDGVPDINDKELNSASNALVDVKGRTIKVGPNTAPSPSSSDAALGTGFWSIFFDSDNASVKPMYDHLVLNLASYMIANPSARVQLIGYTDSSAGSDYNLQLSKMRANNVLANFTKMGIDLGRFDVQYKGESELLVQGETNLSKQLNRRVTLQLK